jgi:hypothetical protein
MPHLVVAWYAGGEMKPSTWLAAPLLTALLCGCGNNAADESKAAANKNPVDTFDLVDRAGKSYVVTDLRSCATIDKLTGEKRCDYTFLYFVSSDVHYRFEWSSIRSLERDAQNPDDAFKVTLETGQVIAGTFDQAPAEGRTPPPIGTANALTGTLVEMGGNTAIFPGSVLSSLRRRHKQ